MKGKRFSTEEKIRILREADTGKSIMELCRDKNIAEATFHRWKREFGLMDINKARRLKELEKKNTVGPMATILATSFESPGVPAFARWATAGRPSLSILGL